MASQNPDVLVLGGGFAGVVAARELRAAGHSVRLLEARDRLGGRTWFRKDALAGHDLEMGGAWIVPEQRHVWAEVERYGLEAPFWGLPSSFGWLTDGVLRHGALPVPTDELPDLERLLLAMREAAARLDLSRPLAGQDVADLDATPADAWLEQLDLPTNTREPRARLVQRHGVGDARRVLDPRGRALARRREQQPLALARRERARPRARTRHGVARRRDRGRRGRRRPARFAGALGRARRRTA